MRIDWVPFSASALVAGATALSVGAILMPDSEGSEDLIRVVQEQGGLWMAVAVLYFFASALLVIGMPSVLTLFERRGMRTGLTAMAVFTIGCVGIAGFAMMLAFIRALVLEKSIDTSNLDAVVAEPGFAIFLYGWIAFFYLGELLLAIALFRARTTPPWIPALLLGHVLLLPVNNLLPDMLQALSALLITVSLAGVGISANNRHSRPLI
jgi:hypothetical protein